MINRVSIFLSGILLVCLSFSYAQIPSDSYHNIRGDLHNSYFKFSKKRKGTVAFLGGSITYNPGWRDSISSFIQHQFPNTKIEFIQAGIPSMGSTPGAFRLNRDILSKGKVDLLFIEAAVNDPTNGRTSKEQIRGMEGIIRHALRANPMMDIITMYFVDPDKIESYNNAKVPEVILNHEKVASHYQVSSINLAKEVTDRINAGEFTWEDDFKNLHPSLFGQMIYYKSIKAFLLKAWDIQPISDIKPNRHRLPTKLDEFSYDHGRLVNIDKAKIMGGWEIVPNWKPAPGEKTREGYVNVPMLCSNRPGSEIELRFKGGAIGIAVAAGPDAGIIEYSVDNGPFKKLDLYTRWSGQLHLPWYYVLESELNTGKHTLTIKISEDKNPESKGNSCRIKHFFINE